LLTGESRAVQGFIAILVVSIHARYC